jgi:hypothetical protein
MPDKAMTAISVVPPPDINDHVIQRLFHIQPMTSAAAIGFEDEEGLLDVT